MWQEINAITSMGKRWPRWNSQQGNKGRFTIFCERRSGTRRKHFGKTIFRSIQAGGNIFRPWTCCLPSVSLIKIERHSASLTYLSIKVSFKICKIESSMETRVVISILSNSPLVYMHGEGGGGSA